MPIYMNQREVPELRMIAVYQLLQTLPERPVLDQIARKTVSERSRHVASFVTTLLMTLANSTNPCEKRMYVMEAWRWLMGMVMMMNDDDGDDDDDVDDDDDDDDEEE